MKADLTLHWRRRKRHTVFMANPAPYKLTATKTRMGWTGRVHIGYTTIATLPPMDNSLDCRFALEVYYKLKPEEP